MKDSKACPKCGQIKPISEWPKNKSKKDGLGSVCKTCHAAKAKTWRQANPEEQLRRSREQFAKSRDRENERRKKRYWDNRDSEIQQRRNNYAANAERYREQSRQWRRNNKDLVDVQWRSARARRAAVRTSKYTVQDVLNKWGTDCHICKRPIDLQAPRWTGAEGWRESLHLDHVIRIRDGGEDTLENVKPSHGECNIRKH